MALSDTCEIPKEFCAFDGSDCLPHVLASIFILFRFCGNVTWFPRHQLSGHRLELRDGTDESS